MEQVPPHAPAAAFHWPLSLPLLVDCLCRGCEFVVKAFVYVTCLYASTFILWFGFTPTPFPPPIAQVLPTFSQPLTHNQLLNIVSSQ